MKNPACFIAALALTASGLSAPAQAEAGSGFTILKVTGDRGWTLDCAFEREGKSPVEKSARGRGRIETLAVRGATGGSCDYAGPRSGAMQIRFTDENDAEHCPFSRVGEHCIGAFGADEKGSFAF